MGVLLNHLPLWEGEKIVSPPWGEMVALPEWRVYTYATQVSLDEQELVEGNVWLDVQGNLYVQPNEGVDKYYVYPRFQGVYSPWGIMRLMDRCRVR